MTTEGGNPQPSIFEDIRVVDFTHILAGPYCTKSMADMGADVIKIEPPGTGELGRALPQIKNGASGFYMWRNSGKRSLCLNMKDPKAVEIFKGLVRISDVVVQNRGPGAMASLGVDYGVLKEINPKIIMCSVSGFGQTGPLADWPGGDMQIQAFAGAMAIGGHADGPPLPAWVPWVDFCTGTHALAAVASALYYREKTGVGQHIDLSMLDCAFSYHDFAIQQYLLSDGQVELTRSGPMHPTLAFLGVYECKDGYLLLGATQQWTALTELLGCPELADDPRLATAAARHDNKDEVFRLISEWIKDYTVDEAVALLEAVGMSCTPILSVAEITHHPQIEAREMLVEMDHPQVGPFKLLNSPFKFSDTVARVRGRAPLLGEHNTELLASLLGYSEERITQLWEDKVLYAEEAVSTLLGR